MFLLALSCEKMPLVEAEASDLTWKEEQLQIEESGYHSEQRYRHPSMSEEQYQGAINAIKKVYQLTNIAFTPLQPIAYNVGIYQANTTYRGMIYSSVKEIGTYVGSNVSFHTFMTAIHNPRSKIYSERIDESPYHGTNCRSYYGTVCSDLVSYALGLTYIGSDFVVSDDFKEVDYSNLDVIHIADVLWEPDHVAIITNVVRDQNEKVVSIEISEAVKKGCKKTFVTRSAFERKISSSYEKVLRYNHLENNTNYIAVPQFVPVFDEIEVPFNYNEDICVDKGDRSCYFVGEDVILNIFSSGDIVEIYKDGTLQSTINVETEDIRLTDLDYGLYQARISKGDWNSDFTSWLMVDCSIESSKDEMIVYFRSNNSLPLSIAFCDKSGSRKLPFTEVFYRFFTEEEISLGYISIPQEKMKSSRQYFRITFETNFGRISTKPIKWL